MIARHWSGATTSENAPAYEEHLSRSVLPHLEALEGFHGMRVLRRAAGGWQEFRVLTFWESRECIHAFAGAAPERAVIHPVAQALLARFDEHVDHFEVPLATDMGS